MGHCYSVYNLIIQLLPRCRIQSEGAGSMAGYSLLANILRVYWSGWSYREKAEVYSLVHSITK